MRDTTITTDDLAVQAAKTRLVELRTRAGYEEALRPPGRESRAGQYWCIGLALVFAALLFACWTSVAGPLGTVLVIVFGTLVLFTVLGAAFGGPTPPPTLWGAAVISESHEQRASDIEPQHRVVLLDENGTSHELIAQPTVADALRAGDVGVAQVRHEQLVGFVRL